MSWRQKKGEYEGKEVNSEGNSSAQERRELEISYKGGSVHFIPFLEDPWEDFLKGARELIERGEGFEFIGNNPQETFYFFEWLKKEFTGKIDLRKVKVSGERLEYGEPSFKLSFGIQRKGQSKIRNIFEELAEEGKEGYFFLDNRPVDLAILDEGDVKGILFSKSGRGIEVPCRIERRGSSYFLILEGGEYEIRNRRGGSFDVEAFPAIAKEEGGFSLRGIRILGRDLVEFCQSMFIEHLSLLRNFEIWGRDWQNRRVILNGLKIRKFKRGSLREVFIKIGEGVELKGMRCWEADVKDPREGLERELHEVIRKYHKLISSMKMEGEEYSLRYSRIMKEVESWEEAVKVSRAAKLKMWELVSKHSINHVIISFYTFYGIPFAEDSSLKKIWVKEVPDRDLTLIAKKRLENCICEELCMGCCFNPCCIEENRYLDRIIAKEAFFRMLFNRYFQLEISVNEMKLDLSSEIFEECISGTEKGIPVLKFFLAGKWREGKEKREIISPINGKSIAKLWIPSEDQIEEALKRGGGIGKKKIRDLPGEKRIKCFLRGAEILEKEREIFIRILILDAGKPFKNAEGEVIATIERLRKTTMEFRAMLGDYIPGDWSEESLESEGIVKREPYGLMLAISPFNYPLFISSSKVIPSLLSGNSVILKPSSKDPIAPLLFFRILELSGIPPESISCLPVSGNGAEKLIRDFRIRAITFTGSTEVGKRILKTGGIKAYHMELGGKDPAIVLDDADLEKTIPKLVKGMLSYSGQRCDAIRLIIVESEIYEGLKEGLIKALRGIEPKNPLEDREALMGPLIDEKAAERIEDAYKDAVRKGGIPLTEFKRRLNYVWPLLIEVKKEIIRELKAFYDDIFGPLTLITRVEDEEEAIEIANSSKFGLDAAIFTSSEVRARRISRRLEVGAVFINDFPRHGIGYYPFGGMKESGIGREGIGYSILQFTTTKTIVRNYKGTGVWEYL